MPHGPEGRDACQHRPAGCDARAGQGSALAARPRQTLTQALAALTARVEALEQECEALRQRELIRFWEREDEEELSVEILDVLAKIDKHLHQQDLYLKQQDERLGRQDRILELQTEQIRLMQLSLQRQDQILERHGQMLERQNQILLQMNSSVERVAQHTAHLGQMAAEHSLLFERTMTILDRIEQRLEARS